jgi:hypothetical protein
MRELNPTTQWIKHAANRAYLLHAQRAANFEQRVQIEHELTICERKLTFWQRFPNWDQRCAQLALVALRNQRN